MVLSIGMIVKNEEKYLERCLTALQPILKELDSELIIADTGSNDRTVEIAKKFTDNVFHFDWINDFAAARNSTLEKAKGEWFMFVDADEIAVDCSEIIKFFKSGEYKKFYSATYVQKSYPDLSNHDTFSEFRVMRVVRKEKDLKFLGRIHEFFSYHKTPTKHLNFTVDHYGYSFTDNGKTTDLAIEKSKRNLQGLFKELETENILELNQNIYSEISDCYNIIQDYEQALEYLERGLRELPHDKISISQYYISKIAILNKLQNMDGIIQTANEYFDKDKNPWHNGVFANDCYVHYWLGYISYKLKDYKKALSEYVTTFDLYNKYKQNKLNTDDLLYASFRINLTLLKAAYDIFFRCCYQEKQFALASEYTRAIPLEKYFDDHNFIENHLKIRVEMMENVGYNNLDELYRQLDEFGKDYLLMVVRRKVFVTKPENRKMIIKKLTALGGLAAELAEIYKNHFENDDPDFESAKALLEKHGSENGEDILYILLENQMDISPFLLADDFFADRAAQILINSFPNGIDLYENYNIDNISQDGLVRATSLYGWVMLRAMEKDHKISDFFEIYSALGLKWYNIFGSSAALPGDIHAALLVNHVVSAKNNGNKTQFMSAVRELKNVVPDLIPLVDAYKEENKDAFKTTRVNPEFEQLAVQVKQNIRGMISAKNISDARSMLKEYEMLCPNDPDIEILKDEINNTLQ